MSVVSLDAAKKYLAALDLNYIVQAMCAETYALPRWTASDAMQCGKLYKNFLYLQKKYPHTGLVPTREIDEFWHNHILYTENYFADCQQIFGHYLHHQPVSGEVDEEAISIAFAQTKLLYLEEFKQPLLLINSA